MPQKLADVAVVIPTVLRPSLLRAVRSVFGQSLAGHIQVVIGIDRCEGDAGVLDVLTRECPHNVTITIVDLGYSTSQRQGGFYPSSHGGALRTVLSFAANSRYVAYLDDDDWWGRDHLFSLLAAMPGKAWAFSYRWLTDRKTGWPICRDEWDAVEPGHNGHQEWFGGFATASNLLLDKDACHFVLPRWSYADFADTAGNGRMIIRDLLELPWTASGRYTCYCEMPDDVQKHPRHAREFATRHINWMRDQAQISTITRLTGEAILSLGQGNSASAIAACQAALAANPHYAPALLCLARAEHLVGNMAKAQSHITHAIEVNDHDAAITSAWTEMTIKAPPAATPARKLSPQALQDLFERGSAAHQQGRLSEAEAIYEDILRQQPNHFNALHLRGLLALQMGQTEQGVKLITKAIKFNSRVAGAHSNLGTGLRTLQRYKEALASYDKAVALKPDHAESHYNRGVVLLELKRPAEASASFGTAVALRPNHAKAHYNRGIALLELKRHVDAFVSLGKAIALQPGLAEAHYHRGSALWELGRSEEALSDFDSAISLNTDFVPAHHSRGTALWKLHRREEAVESYDRAIVLQPGNADLHYIRGAVLQDLRHYEDALVGYGKALQLRPNFAEAHNSRGIVLQALQRHAEALTSYDAAIALQPGMAEAYNNRGILLKDLQRNGDAIASFDKAIALKPDYAEAHNNRGVVLRDMQRNVDALASFDTAMALRPDYAGAHWNSSLSLLLLGDLEQGWQQFEWRKKLDEPIAHRPYPQPAWLGQADVAGKTVFLYSEQGFGDTLQFCRYARLVQALGAQVIMAVPAPLLRLLKQMEPAVVVIRDTDMPPAFDYHCPLMSLPLALGTTFETIPSALRYLQADEQLRASWQVRLARLPGCKIGLVWAGGVRPDQSRLAIVDGRRSVSLATYAPFAAIPGVAYISLQKGPPAAQARTPPEGLVLHDWTEELGDFADTAALIEELDLVISVDTAVAHLAGALGKPVWVLNRFDTCWRWLLGRGDTPWYPSMRLFRQREMGNWSPVVAEVVQALQSGVLPDGNQGQSGMIAQICAGLSVK